MINVFLTEEDSQVRQSLKAILKKEAGLSLVGEEGQGIIASGRIIPDDLDVDVALLGLGINADEQQLFLKELVKLRRDVRVLVLSNGNMETHFIGDAFQNGATGFLMKNVGRDELIFAIKHVASGGKYICSEVSLMLLSKQTSGLNGNSRPVALSKRETEVLYLIAEGLTNVEIATKLYTSRRTIEGHRKNLIAKTGVKNTADLVRFACRHGYIQ